MNVSPERRGRDEYSVMSGDYQVSSTKETAALQKEGAMEGAMETAINAIFNRATVNKEHEIGEEKKIT